jgi:hypothetical protein
MTGSSSLPVNIYFRHLEPATCYGVTKGSSIHLPKISIETQYEYVFTPVPYFYEFYGKLLM